MSDLNMLHAQNADLKSRVSDSGLACDSLASAPDLKDIEAFEIAMRGGEKDFPQSGFASQSPISAPDLKDIEAFEIAMRGREKDFPQSGFASQSPIPAPDLKDIEAFEIAMRGGEKDFPQSGFASQSPIPAPDRMEVEAFEMAMKGDEKGFPVHGHSYHSPVSASEAFSLTMREGGQQFSELPASNPLPHDANPGQLNTLKEEGKGLIDAFGNAMRESAQSSGNAPMQKQEGKYSSESLNVKHDLAQELAQSKPETNPHAQLSSLFSMVSTFNEVEAPATVSAPRAILSEEDLNLLVERILVSAADNGSQEVRLILNERVLAGTEIILSRDLSGQLVVALHCTDVNAFQTLVASQFDLRQMLESREENAVQVSVDIQQDGNDAERRSQGYFEYEPDQLWKRDNA